VGLNATESYPGVQAELISALGIADLLDSPVSASRRRSFSCWRSSRGRCGVGGASCAALDGRGSPARVELRPNSQRLRICPTVELFAPARKSKPVLSLPRCSSRMRKAGCGGSGSVQVSRPRQLPNVKLGGDRTANGRELKGNASRDYLIQPRCHRFTAPASITADMIASRVKGVLLERSGRISA
jgi:hypothetical protein